MLTVLPYVGPNVEAMQATTEAGDELASGALVELVGLSRQMALEDIRDDTGRLDLAMINDARRPLERATISTSAAKERLARIETARLLPEVQPVFDDFASQVEELDTTVDAAARGARLLPPLLGKDGPRRYLMLVQTNSEPRSLGGLVTSMIVLRAEGGRVQIVDQRPVNAFGGRLEVPVPITRSERALYGDQLGEYPQNVTATPDFPRAAQLATQMWRRHGHPALDGVAAVDAVALGSLLRATGPVEFDGGLLTEQNAAETVLNRVYREVPEDDQDDYFGRATAAVFNRLVSGRLDVPTAVEVLTESIDQGRVLLWPAEPAEQEDVAGTRIAGQFRGDHEGAPVVGVYLHDRTQAKLAYYEYMDVSVTSHSCQPDGSQSLTAVVDLTSRVPSDLSGFGTQAGGSVVVPVGELASQVYVSAPTGGEITGVRVSRGRQSAKLVEYFGLQMASEDVVLGRRETLRLEYDIESRGDLPGPVQVRITPGPAANGFTATTSPCPH